MRKLNKKSIDRISSKVLKENLEEKANKLVSKIQNLQELGGMEDEHDIFGEMTPEQLDFIGKLNDDELRTFLDQKRRGAEEEEDERWNPPSLDEEEIEEGFDDESMKDFRMGKDYDRREFKRNIPLGKVDYSDITHKRSGITPEKYVSDEMMDALLKALKRKNREEEQGDDFEDELTEGDGETCEQCGAKGLTEGECSECGYKMNEDLYEIEIEDIEDKFDYIQSDEEKRGEDMVDETEQRRMCERILKKNPEELK